MIPIKEEDIPRLQKAFAAMGKTLKVYTVIFATETRREAKKLAAAAARVTGKPDIAEVVKTPRRPVRIDGVPCLYAVRTESKELARSPELLRRIRDAVPVPKHPRLVCLIESVEEHVFDWCCGRLADILEALTLLVRKLKGATR